MALLLSGLNGCDEGANARLQKLELRVDSVEKQLKEKSDADAERQTNLKTCVTVDAKQAYDGYMKLNGKPVPNRPNVYSASPRVWNEAQKQKDTKIEECKLLYGR